MPTPTRALTHKLRPPLLLTLSWLLTWPLALNAMGLSVAPMSAACQRPAPAAPPRTPMPDEARQRLPESQLAHGRHDLGWVWLGEPTRRYPHRALGSIVHAGSVFAQVRDDRHGWRVVEKSLPLDRVYEDRVPRVLDIDQDGQDEILLIEADARRGAALVVLGVDRTPDGPRLVERARGPYAGSSFRWMNPVGVADFDGDGRADLANVVTPHIGGVLQLLHYQPPRLVPFASAMDVSNHRMGALEQALAVIVTGAGHPPTILVPDMTLQALHALRWEAPGRWKELADLKPLPGPVERMLPLPEGACVTLVDGRTLRATLTP
jgi:hypothetical protein